MWGFSWGRIGTCAPVPSGTGQAVQTPVASAGQGFGLRGFFCLELSSPGPPGYNAPEELKLLLADQGTWWCPDPRPE